MLPSFYNLLCGDCWVATNDVLGSFKASDDETTQRLENSFSGTFSTFLLPGEPNEMKTNSSKLFSSQNKYNNYMKGRNKMIVIKSCLESLAIL